MPYTTLTPYQCFMWCRKALRKQASRREGLKSISSTSMQSINGAQSNQDCCLSYTKARLPRKVIKGFTEQLSSEVCDIDAIIFHTNRGLKACVNPKEDWVKKHLLFLSQKLKKMSM
ncbi:C-C motif chemokine 20 isoform X1 [Numida meleagris]|uniref:C-C motif chemokine 20 isoform X1 n=1 Tax=Numida meleagris TaxID=8996 RepID=UPI000B3DBD12|nr:C-C motif chemokine 20 isoform X1 [Numida meleagris]